MIRELRCCLLFLFAALGLLKDFSLVRADNVKGSGVPAPRSSMETSERRLQNTRKRRKGRRMRGRRRRKGRMTPAPFPAPTPTIPAPIPNDSCPNAITLPLTNEVVVGSNIGASDGPSGTCNLINSQTPGVWFRVPGSGGNIIVNTCVLETEFDTAITVYGSCGLGCVTANDDWCNIASQVTFPTQRNRFYYILVHGFRPENTGIFGVRARSAIPLNDRCQEAGPILTVGDIVKGSTFQATGDFRGDVFNCGTSVGDTPGVWHRVRGTGGRMTADTCGEFTNYDTKIAVFDGNCPGLGRGNCIAGNNDFDACDKKSYVSWNSRNGRIYFIHIHGFLGDNGDYELRIGSG